MAVKDMLSIMSKIKNSGVNFVYQSMNLTVSELADELGIPAIDVVNRQNDPDIKKLLAMAEADRQAFSVALAQWRAPEAVQHLSDTVSGSAAAGTRARAAQNLVNLAGKYKDEQDDDKAQSYVRVFIGFTPLEWLTDKAADIEEGRKTLSIEEKREALANLSTEDSTTVIVLVNTPDQYTKEDTELLIEVARSIGFDVDSKHE